MKNFKSHIILLLLVCCVETLYSQEGKSGIAAVGRFKNNSIELRWLPDNKTILQTGFTSGYIIRKREADVESFQDIAVIKPGDKSRWEQMIAAEKDTAERTAMETAMEFLFAGSLHDKPIDMEKGIAELNDAKSKEDLVYALFVLSTTKSKKVAEALGLGYTDIAVTPGKKYEYNIIFNARSPVYTVGNGIIAVNASVDKNPYKTEVFVFTGDKQLSFAWSTAAGLSGFFVERAKEGAAVFTPMNDQPFYASTGQGFDGIANGTYKDDSLTNYKWYRYRFYGMDAFGEKILFAEAKGMPRDLTPPPQPLVKQPKHIKPKQVAVSWEMQGKVTDLRGFIIGRSDKDTGNFTLLHKKLLATDTRMFIDSGFNTGSLNYYVVYAVDTAGNISASYPAYVALIDSTPPAKPEIASAIIDSSGVVTLSIKKGKETDLKGYRVYKSNDIQHEASAIKEFFKEDDSDTASIELVLKDTIPLNTITPKIYYKVKALDYNYNQSVFSEYAVVTKPDTIPPVTPVFTNVLVSNNKIELQFANSESPDVKEQLLYRRTDPKQSWMLLQTLSPAEKKAIDTSVQSGTTYYYALRAKDEMGLLSPFANAVTGKPYNDGLLPAVQRISSAEQDKAIVLKWEYPQQNKKVYFIIYKQDKNGHLVQAGRVTDNIFTDQTVALVNTYAIKAITADGDQSKLSTLITQKSIKK